MLDHSLVDFKKDNNTGDIIDYSIVFLPFLSSSTHYSVARLLRGILHIVWPYDSSYHFIREKFPNTITSYYDKLIV